MRSSLLLVSAVLLAPNALAVAAPDAPAPAPHPAGKMPPALPPSCALTGEVLVSEVSRTLVATPKGNKAPPTFATRVFVSGGWDRTDTDADGKQAKVKGCLGAADLTKLHRSLDGLPWTTTPNPATCDALSATVTDVIQKDKVVWTVEMCPAKLLDAKSEAGLAAANAVLDAARKTGKP